MSEVWEESGSIVYVAITILIFVLFVLLAVWLITKTKTKKRYSPVEGKNGDEEESLEMVQNDANKDAFTIDASDDSEDDIDLYSNQLEEPEPLEAV